MNVPLYQHFGIRDEGPTGPHDISSNLQIVDDLLCSNEIERDILLIDRLNADLRLRRLFRDCDALFEEIADHAHSTALLEELNSHYTAMNLDIEQLFSGIQWYAQACESDPRTGDQIAPTNLMETMAGAGIPHQQVLGYHVVGATVLRLYIALVYLRGDWVRGAITQVAPTTVSSLGRYQRLFEHEIVRHARNALAHGHIRPTIAGLCFRDRAFEAILTPGFINKLCSWIFVFHYSAFMVHQKRSEQEP